MLNHSFKNEIAKVKICIKNMTPYIKPSPVTAESMQIIDDSFNHLFNMVSRIQEKTKAIILKEEPCELSSIINYSINKIRPIYRNRNIEIVNKVKPGIVLLFDKVHLEEVISDILKVEIRDNGSGIEKELLPSVFEPFFSTKHPDDNPDDNYGLGLSYSLNVIQKSGGTIEIQSEPNQGTAVALKIPP